MASRGDEKCSWCASAVDTHTPPLMGVRPFHAALPFFTSILLLFCPVWTPSYSFVYTIISKEKGRKEKNTCCLRLWLMGTPTQKGAQAQLSSTLLHTIFNLCSSSLCTDDSEYLVATKSKYYKLLLLACAIRLAFFSELRKDKYHRIFQGTWNF